MIFKLSCIDNTQQSEINGAQTFSDRPTFKLEN